jgi:Cysteine-rich CWC
MSELRPDRCPICGGPNDCGGAAGKRECWCSSVKISSEALARVPEEAKGNVCMCATCASILAAKVRE